MKKKRFKDGEIQYTKIKGDWYMWTEGKPKTKVSAKAIRKLELSEEFWGIEVIWHRINRK